MNRSVRDAPSPLVHPIRAGTRVELDESATFLEDGLLSGGAPWRLVRLPERSRQAVRRWRDGDPVTASEGGLARRLVQYGLVRPVFEPHLVVDDVEVIIPVHDDAAPLRALLQSLSGLHVTVVDDGSMEPDVIAECATQYGVTLIRLERNVGPGAARNAGARSTSRPLLWFVDADVVIDDPLDVLGRLAAHLDDPLVGAAAPRIRGGAGTSVRDRFERDFSPLDVGPTSGVVRPGAAIPYVASACLVVRRDAFADGFDDTLRFGEDVDLVWRLHDEGWLVRYDAQVTVTHRARGTWRQWFHQRLVYGSSSSALARRHGTRLAPVRVDPWTLVAWSSLLAGRPLVSLRIAAVARRTLRTSLEPVAADPQRCANELLRRGLVGAGGPMARAIVRTFGPVVLASMLAPRLRRRAVLLFVIGTAWRWRSRPVAAIDVPLAIADDLTYAAGVYRGAWRDRTLGALRPQVMPSSLRLRDVLGRSRASKD